MRKDSIHFKKKSEKLLYPTASAIGINC